MLLSADILCIPACLPYSFFGHREIESQPFWQPLIIAAAFPQQSLFFFLTDAVTAMAEVLQEVVQFVP